MYEHHRQRVLSPRAFFGRLARHIGIATVVVLGSLVGGMAGYAHFEGMNTLDSFLNAAMILGGMGPVATPQTSGGKAFAGIYALYSGMIFLVVAGIVLAPVMHRVLHKFHWLDEEGKGPPDASDSPPRKQRRG